MVAGSASTAKAEVSLRWTGLVEGTLVDLVAARSHSPASTSRLRRRLTRRVGRGVPNTCHRTHTKDRRFVASGVVAAGYAPPRAIHYVPKYDSVGARSRDFWVLCR